MPASLHEILLVEDHLALAEIFCRLLEDGYDHQVELATIGAQALGGLRKAEPELVLVDIDPPDMDGYELAAGTASCPAPMIRCWSP